MSNFFLTEYPMLLENFTPFSSNLKLLTAKPFNFEESKFCRLGNVQMKKAFKSMLGKGENPGNQLFSSTGRRPESLCHGPLSVVRMCVRASVRVLTFSLNIFSETTYRILMKFHRNVPTMVLFRIS